MKIINTYENLSIPAYALPYLIYEDAGDMTETEIQKIERYMKQFYEQGLVIINYLPDSEPFFTKYPEFGLACDCIDCSIVVYEA